MSTAAPIPPPVGGNLNRGPALVDIFWTECVIALVFVSLRCYARILVRNLGIDDWIMFTTMVRAAQGFPMHCVAQLTAKGIICACFYRDDIASTQRRG